MKIPFYQIDAFTSRVFSGNPAGVCLLETWIEERVMQSIAAENNLSETAFLVKVGNLYELCWVSPTVEVDLCGHATLASAFVVFEFLDPQVSTVTFNTKGGILRVKRHGDLFVMNFPARPPVSRNRYPTYLIFWVLNLIKCSSRETLSWCVSKRSNN